MKLPRFKVSTLLVATTILAVVMVYFISWTQFVRHSLGSVTQNMWVLGGFNLIGLLLGASLHTFYFTWRQNEIEDELGSEGCRPYLRFAPKHWSVWRVLSLTLVLGAILIGGSAEQAHSLAHPPINSLMLAYYKDYWAESIGLMFVGSLLSRLFLWPEARSRYSIRWTDTAMHFPGYPKIPWKNLRRYEWIDRESGRLNIVVPSKCTFPIKLVVRPEDVDAVDALLSSKMDIPSE